MNTQSDKWNSLYRDTLDTAFRNAVVLAAVYAALAIVATLVL
jgi:hypothetical protein